MYRLMLILRTEMMLVDCAHELCSLMSGEKNAWRKNNGEQQNISTKLGHMSS
jgi:hypothetical protein